MKVNPVKIEFKKFDFEHELAILYSSGALIIQKNFGIPYGTLLKLKELKVKNMKNQMFFLKINFLKILN